MTYLYHHQPIYRFIGTLTKTIKWLSLSLSLFLVCPVYFAQASAPMSKHDMSLPVEVTSDTLEIVKNKQIATFSGHVVVLQGQLKLTSDTVTVHYKEKDNKPTPNSNDHIKKIVADGNVHFNTPGEQASAKQGIYDVEHQTITLTQNVILKKGKNIVTGSKLVYNLETGQSQLIEESTSPSGTGNKRVKGVFIPQ
jgi:lipopolysaccharide export system protein LptA